MSEGDPLSQMPADVQYEGKPYRSRDVFKLAPEIYSAVFQAFPDGKNLKKGEPFNPLKMDYEDRELVIIDAWEWKTIDSTDKWIKENAADYAETTLNVRPFDDPSTPEDESQAKKEPKKNTPPTGMGGMGTGAKPKPGSYQPPGSGGGGKPGRVLVLNCYHDHNNIQKYPNGDDREKGYVRNTVIRNLLYGRVKFKNENTTFRQLGLSYPTIVTGNGVDRAVDVEIPNPHYERFLKDGKIPETPEDEWTDEEKRKYSKTWTVRRYNFQLEILWKPMLETKRAEIRKEQAEKRKAAEAKRKKAAEAAKKAGGPNNNGLNGNNGNPKKGPNNGNPKNGNPKNGAKNGGGAKNGPAKKQPVKAGGGAPKNQGGKKNPPPKVKAGADPKQNGGNAKKANVKAPK